MQFEDIDENIIYICLEIPKKFKDWLFLESRWQTGFEYFNSYN